MTVVAAPTSVEADDVVFDVAAYDLPVPRIDDLRATNLRIGFSGAGVLDRTSEDDLALLTAMRMGREVRLIVTGTIAGKGFRLGADEDDLAFNCTVRVSNVEAGELA